MGAIFFQENERSFTKQTEERMNKRRKAANSVWTGTTKRRKKWKWKQEKVKKKKKNLFNRLPTQLCLEIFSHVEFTTRVGVIASVCKAWRALIFSTLPHETKIELKDKVKKGGLLLSFIVNHCPSLRSIQLTGVTLSDHRLETFSKYFTNLQRIDLSNAGWAINDTGIAVLCKNCVSLQGIILRRCYNLGDPSGIAIAECGKLEEVNMKFCHYLTTDGVRMIVSNRGPYLTKMVFVRDCVNSMTFAEICKSCINLEHCGVQQSTIKGKQLVELAKNCPKLKRLNVRYCPKVREKDILRFQQILPQCRVAYHKWTKKILPSHLDIK